MSDRVPQNNMLPVQSRSLSRRDFMKLAAGATAFLIDQPASKVSATLIDSKENLPVVVIGGGLGGLSAAAHLVRNGFPVTLVEQHDKIGGYATNFERMGGKYNFDVSLHATASARCGLKPALEGAGVLDKIETIELPEACRIIMPEHDLVWPQRNPEAIIEQLTGLFPKDAKGIQGFFSEMMGIIDEAMKPFDSESRWDKLTFPLTHRKMWAIRNKSLADVLDQYTRDDKVRSILSVFWPYYGLPPSRLSGFYYSIATASYLRFGGYTVKNRSQDLSDALGKAIEAGKGRILLDTEAVGITEKDGAVTGVKLSDGTLIGARAVISNASVPATIKMLPLNSAPRDYLDKLAGYRPSLSTFVVWLGLNQSIRGKVNGYEIFLHPHYDPERDYRASIECDPQNSSCGVAVYDNAIEGYSKPGTSTVSIVMLSGYEPWRRFEADYFAGHRNDYWKEKDRIARMLVNRAEKMVIPGLSSMIEVMEAATPLTNLRYTRNPEGAIYGYEQSLANSYMNRLKNKTPVKGLYFASAWSDPGGGYQPCLQSGAKAFRALVRDWGGR
jgi:all-trans-retinol 13,14-reductase